MRRILDALMIIAIGLVLGGYTAWYFLQSNQGIGGITAGSWTAWPFAGGTEADPYTVAKVAREGTIPLGATEGLAFKATRDSLGDQLSLDCDYTLSGLTPPAKLWTLAAYHEDGRLVRPASGGSGALHSGEILRFPDGSFRIQVSERPRPGNWVSLTGDGEFYLVLRIYDTPVTSATGLATPQMPTVIRGDCRS